VIHIWFHPDLLSDLNNSAYCLPLDSPNVRMQLWDLPCPGGTQQLNLHGGGTCLTAGAIDDGLLPSDGTPITVRECHNEPVQVWTFESDALQFCLGNGDGMWLLIFCSRRSRLKAVYRTMLQRREGFGAWKTVADPVAPQSADVESWSK
jgi:hypothetical protein